jgi:hypothetical protein
MKKFIWSTMSFSIAILFMFGCANWGGNNPVGVTGGSEQGYGTTSDLNLPAPVPGSSSDLIGTWRADYGGGDYELLTFTANGKFNIAVYDNNDLDFSYSGNYSTSGNTLTLYIEGQPYTGTFSVRGDVLTLSIFDDSQTYYRL